MYDNKLCKKGLHPFKIISKQKIDIDEYKIVRWCPECGSIVVDLDIDNRTYPGYYQKIIYPNIVEKYGL